MSTYITENWGDRHPIAAGFLRLIFIVLAIGPLVGALIFFYHELGLAGDPSFWLPSPWAVVGGTVAWMIWAVCWINAAVAL